MRKLLLHQKLHHIFKNEHKIKENYLLRWKGLKLRWKKKSLILTHSGDRQKTFLHDDDDGKLLKIQKKEQNILIKQVDRDYTLKWMNKLEMN